MNRLLFLFFILIVAFSSCDGRDRKHKTSKEVLEENGLLESFSENIKYFPEEYAEHTNDTILSNGFRVKIKNYTNMNNSILHAFKADTIQHKHYFREIVSEIIVYKDEKLIFKESIDSNFLSNSSDYLNNEIVVDEYKSLKTDKLHLIASQCIPKSINCSIYNIIIDEKGNYELKKNEDVRT